MIVTIFSEDLNHMILYKNRNLMYRKRYTIPLVAHVTIILTVQLRNCLNHEIYNVDFQIQTDH